jgi:Tol biopolymer transport system component
MLARIGCKHRSRGIAMLLLAIMSLLAASAHAAIAPRFQANLTPVSYLPLMIRKHVDRLAFTSFRSSGGEIYLINADGTQLTRLTNNFSHDYLPLWSPDGSRLLFLSDRDHPPILQIYVMNADGSNQTRLTNEPNGAYHPAWSPDGTMIAYFMEQDLHSDLYLIHVDGSGRTLLTSEPAYAAHVRWSPDGQQLAFISSNLPVEASMSVVVMSIDRSQRIFISDRSKSAGAPVWFPDGKRLAFIARYDIGSCVNGRHDIAVANADGSGQMRLTNSSGDNNEANKSGLAVSPNGAMLAFVGSSGGGDIFVLNADGSGLRNISNTPTTEFSPAWSPDSNQLAIVSHQDMDTVLYLINADGSNRFHLISSLVANNPAWRP